MDSMRMCMREGKSHRAVEWGKMASWRGHLCTVLGIEGNIRLIGDYSDMLQKYDDGTVLPHILCILLLDNKAL